MRKGWLGAVGLSLVLVTGHAYGKERKRKSHERSREKTTEKAEPATSSAKEFAPEKTPYVVVKLENGLELVMLESHKVPLVTMVLASKAGAMTERPETNGLTHLWEHMFFKGNKRLSNQEAFEKRVRQLGIVYNGDTAAEKVRYYFTLPSAFLGEGMQFMADAISTPLLDKVELEKERRVVLDEYDRNASQPGFDLYNLHRKLLYGDLGYLRDPLGQRAVIEKATRDQLLQIKDEVFVPANCALLVAGSFEQEKLVELAREHFGDWETPKGWKPRENPPFPKLAKSVDFVMTRPLVENAQISMLFNGPRVRVEPKPTFAADVLSHLLSHRSSRFYRRFIDSGLTVSAQFGYFTQAQAGEIFVEAVTKPESATKVKNLLAAEMKEWVKDDYFDPTLFEDVRRRLVIEHKRDLNKPSEFIKTLAFWWAVTGLDYYESYMPSMQAIELKDVQAFVKEYLLDKPYVASIFLSPENAKKANLQDTSGPLVAEHLKEYLAAKSETKTTEKKK